MKNILVIFGLLICLQSCKKSDTSPNLLSPQGSLLSKMMKIQNADAGSILITTSNRNFKKSYDFDVKAAFKDPSYQEVTINDVSLEVYIQNGEKTNIYLPKKEFSKEQLSELFGKQLQISLKKSDLSLRTDNSIYNPFYFDMNGGARNTALSWNRDNNNGKVYILIQFNPARAINENFANYGSYEKFIETDDDGFYQVTSSDLSGVPLGGNVDIIVARGNTAIIGGQSNGQNAVSVRAFSSSTVSGFYQSGGSTGGGNEDNAPKLRIL